MSDLAGLKREIIELRKLNAANVRLLTSTNARVLALSSMLAEVAAEVNLPVGEFNRHLDMRVRHFQEKIWIRAESIAPATAAQTDPSTVEDYAKPSGIEKMFPEARQ